MARKQETHQLAVAVVDHNTETATSSKKKRKRKEKEVTDVVEDTLPIDDADARGLENPEHRKKKKKKKRHAVEIEAQESSRTTDAHDQYVVGEDARPERQELSKKEKKKKKKDKHREQRHREQPSDPHIDPALTAMDATSGTNSNAFMAAVVTAAAGAVVPESSSFMSQLPPLLPPGFQNLPPGLGGPPVAFSGEDLARALQCLDVAKLADALQALGEAGSSAFPLPGGQSMPSQSAPDPLHNHPPLRPTQLEHMNVNSSSASGQSQISTPSSATQGQSAGNPSGRPTSQKSVPVPVPIGAREDHAHLLASRWLSATKLNELSKTIGLQYKKGKFSASEEAMLKNAIEDYRLRNGLTHDELNEVIFAKGLKDKNNAFWFEITSNVPSRPVVAVYHHVRRSFHPLKQQGKWSPVEDDALRQAVIELGQSWEKVSLRVGRMAADCRDRWRNHINNREGRVYGVWSKEEEDRLTQIVTEMTIAQGKNPDLDVFWTQVAARMGNRGRQQCRIKWTDCLSKTVKNAGQKPRWSQQDAYILVHKIASLNVNDDSEIDWKLLCDENWNLWSAHTLQRRWLTLKRSVKGYEEMTHQEIMDILRAKKAHPPPMPAPVKRRVTSAPIVPAEAQAADVAIEDTFPLAGPSGFGVMHGAPFPIDAGQQPQVQFSDFMPITPPSEPPQAVVADSAGAGTGNVQQDNPLPLSSTSDSDASDSE